MSGCGCSSNAWSGGGPFSTGRELVEFVYFAHDGAIRDQPIMQGSLAITCQGCNRPFSLETYLGTCPHCGGVHAVAPISPTPDKVQFAGNDYQLPR